MVVFRGMAWASCEGGGGARGLDVEPELEAIGSADVEALPLLSVLMGAAVVNTERMMLSIELGGTRV